MQILLNGVMSGLTLGLLALAFAIVYVPTRVFHVSLGGLYTICPFIVWYMLSFSLPWPLAVISAILFNAALSWVVEAFNHSPLRKKGASPGVHLVSSLGIFIILAQLTALIWGNDVRTLRPGVDQVLNLGDLSFTRAQVIGALVATLILIVFFGWLRWSRLGLQLRALATNEIELELHGYDICNLRLACFTISGALCAAAAILISYDTGFSPQAGLPALLLAIVATIVGGKRSIFVGPIVGGVIVGVLRAETSWVLSARWQEATTFLLLIVFLLLWPIGLTARPARVKANQ
jgi:branched-chain amino acid transport system permease protein